MADDVDTLVAELQAIVDVDDPAALRRLNSRHRTMVARARSYQPTVAIGNTVVGQAGYPFPSSPEIVELLQVYVDGVPYGKAKRDDDYSYSQGGLIWEGPTGLWFAEEDSELILIPAPSTAGLAITALAACYPPDLAAGQPASAFKIDGEFQEPLVNGAAATELLRIGEGDPASMEATFTAACEEQRRRVDKRMRGSGPA